MRIGHITHAYKPICGGQEAYISNLYEVLSNRGYIQRVYQPDTGVRSPELELVPQLPTALRLRAAELYAFNVLLLASKWRKLVREDLLIVHYAFHYPPVAWHPNVVIVSHGVEWDNPPKKLNHKVRRTIAQISFRSERCRLVANDSDYLRQFGIDLPPKQGMFQEVAPGKWFIPNGVDISRFRRTTTWPELSRLHPILVPRNLVPRRGIDIAIKAFARFVEVYPFTHLVIVGGPVGPGYGLYNELARLAQELGVSEKVVFWGPVPWELMPHVYSSSLRTLVPSTFGEGTSLSALESMSCGTVTIASNVGGLLDLPCLTVDPDPNCFAEAMLDVFNKRDRLGEEQQGITRAVYNTDNWTEAWLKVVRREKEVKEG